MASPTVTTVYVQVIEDVINKVRDEFLNVGAGEAVLNELQGLWEMKMMQCGAICGPIERNSVPRAVEGVAPVHDLNMPYEGTEEYETPTAEMLFPPTPLQTPIQTPLPGIENTLYQLPGGNNDYASVQDNRGAADVKPGRPSPYMQPPSPWMNQRPLGVDVNVAYVEGRDDADRGNPQHPLTQDFFMMSSGKRKRDDYASQVNQGGQIPQQDGARGDAALDFSELEVRRVKQASGIHGRDSANNETLSMQDVRVTRSIPQQDGVHDSFEDLFHLPGVAGEEYGTPADQDLHATPSVGTPRSTKLENAEDDEPPLNEDDDDDDDLDDLEQGEEEPSTHHLVLAQFDKVTRTKSRWKCMLKDGIMHFNNKDILFNKATGEFDF